MRVKTEKSGIIITVLFFILFFIVGITIFDDYGPNVDDFYERNTGLITLKFILQEKLGVQSIPNEISEAADLLTYEDKDYGVVLQLPVVLFEYFNNFRFDLSTVVKIRHLWVFLNFYLASIFFYLLFYKRFCNWFYSLIAVVFLVLSPRIFGESFINIKDLLFLSWFIISLYFFIRFIFSPNIKNDILLGITITLSSNVRIIGLIILFLFCIFLLMEIIRKEIMPKRFLLLVIIQFLITGFLWILFLPASWNNPVNFLFDAIKHFSHYDLIQSELYKGNLVFSDQLPWHYLIIWIGVTTPIIYFIFFVLGLGQTVNEVKKKDVKNNFLDLSMIFLVSVPIILIIFFRSTLYNGWRHLYFIYIPFLYIAILGFVFLCSKKNRLMQFFIGLFTCISLVNTLVWMIRNHPYQYVYFNYLAESFGLEKFEKDYWRISSSECLNFIINQDDNLRIGLNDYQAALHSAKFRLNKKDRDRIITSSYVWPAKYIVANYTKISTNELKFPFYTPIHHVKVDDMKIASVYQRDHQHDLWAQEVVEKINTNVNSHLTANMFDGDLNSNWMTGKLQNSSDYLDIEFKYPLLLNGLTTYIGENENERPWSLQILSSEDGLNWEPVEIVNQNFIDYEIKEVKTKYLRIKNSEPSEKYTWAVYELLFHGTKLEDG